MQIHALSATDLLRLLQGREISAHEVVTALHERADRVSPSLNGFVHEFRAEALETAKQIDTRRSRGEPVGPLAGLPVTIKESIATKGLATTLGVRPRSSKIATEDAVIVKLLRAADAILLAKTNVSQVLLFHESDNAIWGKTANPWNTARTCGGSSGGEAAMIASGASVCGIGTDIGGSIRVPAAWCGIAGLKPTVDRWSNLGCVAAIAGQEAIRGQCGPMARSARDLSLLFRTIDSPQHARFDPAVAPMQTPDPEGTRIDQLRIGYFDQDGFLSVSGPIRRAVESAVAVLRSLGATVIPFAPTDTSGLVSTYLSLMSSDGGVTLRRFLEDDDLAPQLETLWTILHLPKSIQNITSQFLIHQGEDRVAMLLQSVRRRTVAEYFELVHLRAQMRIREFEAWDRANIAALICPAHATVALRHGQSRNFSLGGTHSMRYNLLNFPAGVVPICRVRENELPRKHHRDRLDAIAAEVELDSKDLPVGVQIVARPFREDVVLKIMIALEEACSTDPEFPTTPIDPIAKDR